MCGAIHGASWLCRPATCVSPARAAIRPRSASPRCAVLVTLDASPPRVFTDDAPAGSIGSRRIAFGRGTPRLGFHRSEARSRPGRAASRCARRNVALVGSRRAPLAPPIRTQADQSLSARLEADTSSAPSISTVVSVIPRSGHSQAIRTAPFGGTGQIQKPGRIDTRPSPDEPPPPP